MNRIRKEYFQLFELQYLKITIAFASEILFQVNFEYYVRRVHFKTKTKRLHSFFFTLFVSHTA
jgi:hypothetical protein